MPSIAERAAETEVSRDGMPQRVSVPKPAPIPEGVDIHAQPEQTLLLLRSQFRVTEEKEQQKNASIGLVTIIILVILAVLAWLFFK